MATIRHWLPPGFGGRDYRGFYWCAPANDELGIKHVNTYSASGPDWDDGELDGAKKFVRNKVAEWIKGNK